jgi:hypothetical protein
MLAIIFFLFLLNTENITIEKDAKTIVLIPRLNQKYLFTYIL